MWRAMPHIARLVKKVKLAFLSVLLLRFGPVAAAQSLETAPAIVTSGTSSTSRSRFSSSVTDLGINPGSASTTGIGVVPAARNLETGVDWGHLFASSAAFLVVSHSFRCATESTTQRQFHVPFFPAYANAVGNLHGWSDGDPFTVNYIGHPMEGAVSSFLWQHDDRAYRTVEFGRNRRYWKAKLRGMGFAFVYSAQFEIGPLSEASIGHIQNFYPQVGFVDHVVTPTLGTGWAVAEDAIDRKLIQPFEAKFGNSWLRLVARSGLNPARSFANVLGGNLPWHRDDRPGVFQPFPESAAWATEYKRRTGSVSTNPPPGVAPFDFTFHATFRDYLNNRNAGACMGGGGTAAFRTGSQWQVLLNVDGCKLMDARTNWSGDSLMFTVGPQWTPQTSRRWQAHVQAMIGGMKVTQEYVDPYLKSQVGDWRAVTDEDRAAKHAYYSTAWDKVGFAMQAGAGVDYKLNRALALRVAELGYAHSWVGDIDGLNYHNAVQVSGGLVLHMGTW